MEKVRHEERLSTRLPHPCLPSFSLHCGARRVKVKFLKEQSTEQPGSPLVKVSGLSVKSLQPRQMAFLGVGKPQALLVQKYGCFVISGRVLHDLKAAIDGQKLTLGCIFLVLLHNFQQGGRVRREETGDGRGREGRETEGEGRGGEGVRQRERQEEETEGET